MTLLERGSLLAQSHDLLEESRQGRGRLILISGEAGIGKTALVEAFCRDAAIDVDVLWGSCHVSAILRKLGVSTRAAAAQEAVRLGFEDGEIVAPNREALPMSCSVDRPTVGSNG